MSQAKDWCFTDYDVSDDRMLFLLGVDCNYMVFQEEQCPTTSKRHYQGFVQFKKKIRMTGVKKILGKKVHLEKRRGTATEAADYCQKEDTRVNGPWFQGEIQKQGKRVDLDELAEMALKEGTTKMDLMQANPSGFMRYGRGLEDMRRTTAMQRYRKKEPIVHVYWGYPGTGKSTRAYEESGFYEKRDEVYLKDSEGKWFFNYDGQKKMIIDDFDGNIPISIFKKLLGGKPFELRVNGGQVPCLVEEIWITSNIPYEEWYGCHREIHTVAIKRRLTDVVEYTKEDLKKFIN